MTDGIDSFTTGKTADFAHQLVTKFGCKQLQVFETDTDELHEGFKITIQTLDGETATFYSSVENAYGLAAAISIIGWLRYTDLKALGYEDEDAEWKAYMAAGAHQAVHETTGGKLNRAIQDGLYFGDDE